MSAGADTQDLKMLLHADLKSGATVPGPIYNQQGHVLVPAGETLTEERLATLNGKRLRSGQEWEPAKSEAASEPDTPSEPTPPAPASAEEVIEQLFERESTTEPIANQRSQNRFEYQAPLNIKVRETEDESSAEQSIQATCNNISETGFCFWHDHPVPEGAIVSVVFDHLPERPKLQGIVRNCTHLDEDDHRIGVEFTDRG